MVKYERISASAPVVRRDVEHATFVTSAPRQLRSVSAGRPRNLVSFLIFLAAMVLCFGRAQDARAQISPGPLARPHHQFEGPANCTKCHTQAVRERAFKCTECHKEIGAELQQHRGLHSTYSNEGRPSNATPTIMAKPSACCTGHRRIRDSTTRRRATRLTASTPQSIAGNATR